MMPKLICVCFVIFGYAKIITDRNHGRQELLHALCEDFCFICETYSVQGMVENRPFARDRVLLLSTAARRDFVEGAALHTSRKKLVCSRPKLSSRAALW